MSKQTGKLDPSQIVRFICQAVIDEHGLSDTETMRVTAGLSLTAMLKTPARTASKYNDKVNFSR